MRVAHNILYGSIESFNGTIQNVVGQFESAISENPLLGRNISGLSAIQAEL